MKENVLKSFIRDTYKTSSIVPYIITGQVIMFVIIHILELVSFSQITNSNIFNESIATLSLPQNWSTFIQKPWTLITHPFVYQGLFNLLFDCLWLYWIGNLFLSFLNNRQFNTLFIGGLLLGGLCYISLGMFNRIPAVTNFYNTAHFGLAALVAGTSILLPNLETRLLLFGNVKFKFIAIIYLAFEFAFLMTQDKVAALVYFLMVVFGITFIAQLQKGNDWSKIFVRKKKTLKVIMNDSSSEQNRYKKHRTDFENQEIIDQILDKISLKGYESLTSQEKDTLFKASKEDN